MPMAIGIASKYLWSLTPQGDETMMYGRREVEHVLDHLTRRARQVERCTLVRYNMIVRVRGVGRLI